MSVGAVGRGVRLRGRRRWVSERRIGGIDGVSREIGGAIVTLELREELREIKKRERRHAG